MYDSICKIIVETSTPDLSAWLLGERILLSRLEPTELSIVTFSFSSVILR